MASQTGEAVGSWLRAAARHRSARPRCPASVYSLRPIPRLRPIRRDSLALCRCQRLNLYCAGTLLASHAQYAYVWS